MARRPLRMSVIRPDGTLRSKAKRLALSLRAANSRFSKRPGCTTGAMCSTSVVIDNFDVVCVALAKLETDAPALVHGHRPLIFSTAFELVETNAPQRAQIAQRLRRVQRQQQIDGRLEVQPAKLVRSLAVPDLAGRGIPPRPDHGRNILRETVSFNEYNCIIPRSPPPQIPADRQRTRAAPCSDRSIRPWSAPAHISSVAAAWRWDRPSASASAWP